MDSPYFHSNLRQKIVYRMGRLKRSVLVALVIVSLLLIVIKSQVEEEKSIQSKLPSVHTNSTVSGIHIIEIELDSIDRITIQKEDVLFNDLSSKLNSLLDKHGHKGTTFVLKNDDHSSYSTYLDVYSSLKDVYDDYKNRYCFENLDISIMTQPMISRVKLMRKYLLRLTS
jgi:biopolymer transport protein ExbD